MNIYVGNLSLDVTEEELRQEFMAFGRVISVTIMNDKDIGSGQPRRYGFVEMPSKSEGYTAIAGLNRKTLRGHVVDVIEALPLSHNTGSGATGGRRGSRYSGRGRKHTY
jgi:RNA recognition motif-containing protein